MSSRKNIGSDAPWEDLVGYSRAVRVGNMIEVTGTAAANAEGVVHVGDAYEQTRYILQKIAHALQQAGARMEDVVRTRIFVTDIDQWEAIGKAHRECFAEIRPATTMVEVQRLIDPKMLVEIEATAIIEI